MEIKFKEDLETINTLPVRNREYLHVTHTDADGVACAIVEMFMGFVHMGIYDEVHKHGHTKDKMIKKAMSFIAFAEPETIIEKLMMRLLSLDYLPKKILITDLSFPETRESESLISILEDRGVSLKLIDHHRTAKWMEEKYPWVTIDESVSAAFLLFEECCRDREKDFHEEVTAQCLLKYVQEVSDYDTWKWKEDGKPECENHSILLNLYDKFHYIENNIRRLLDVKTMITKDEMNMVEKVKRTRIKKAQKVKETGKVIFLHEIHMFICYGDVNISSISDYLYKESGVETVGLIDLKDKDLSVRSEDPNFDAGSFCKTYGVNGGGHPGAAGMLLTDEDYNHIIRHLFNISAEE